MSAWLAWAFAALSSAASWVALAAARHARAAEERAEKAEREARMLAESAFCSSLYAGRAREAADEALRRAEETYGSP